MKKSTKWAVSRPNQTTAVTPYATSKREAFQILSQYVPGLKISELYRFN